MAKRKLRTHKTSKGERKSIARPHGSPPATLGAHAESRKKKAGPSVGSYPQR